MAVSVITSVDGPLISAGFRPGNTHSCLTPLNTPNDLGSRSVPQRSNNVLVTRLRVGNYFRERRQRL